MNLKRKAPRRPYLLASCFLGILLLAGIQKIIHPDEFSLAVYRFHLLPDFLVNIVALYLTWLQLACAICLLFIPRYRVAALTIVLLLLCVFTCGIIINLLRGTNFSCGCFTTSPLAKPMSWLSVIRNGILMGLVAIALFGNRKAPRN